MQWQDGAHQQGCLITVVEGRVPENLCQFRRYQGRKSLKLPPTPGAGTQPGAREKSPKEAGTRRMPARDHGDTCFLVVLPELTLVTL